jgi:hypothetical protein
LSLQLLPQRCQDPLWVLQQIKHNLATAYDYIGARHRRGRRSLFSYYANPENRRLEHEGVICTIADGNGPLRSELFDKGFFLFVLFLSIDSMYRNSRLPHFLFNRPVGISGKQVDSCQSAEFHDLALYMLINGTVPGNSAIHIKHNLFYLDISPAGNANLYHA